MYRHLIKKRNCKKWDEQPGKVFISFTVHDIMKSVSLYQAVYPSICLSIHLSVQQSVSQSISQAVTESVFQCMHHSISLSVRYFQYVSACTYMQATRSIISSSVYCLQAQIEDGPDDDGNMFTRPGKVRQQANYDLSTQLLAIKSL